MARWYRSRYGIKRRVKLPKIPGILLVTLVLILIAILSFNIVERNLKPTITQIAHSRAHLIATEAINHVLYEKVLADVDYTDLINVHKDSQQHITLMQANTIKISRIVSQASLEIKQALKNLQEDSFQVPLGQILGSQLLANYGPRIKVRIVPVGTIDVSLDDQFQQAGINQARHILYLNIKTTVQIVIPLARESISVNNQIPIAETIIVGQVPNTYVGLDQMLLNSLVEGKGNSNP